jgi:hypothetical protein
MNTAEGANYTKAHGAPGRSTIAGSGARPSFWICGLASSLNIYICREMFVRYAAHLNSMQGFWIAMAERTGGAWFHSDWWRFRDCGATLEFVYAPLVPAMSAWTASVRGVPQDVAF